MSNYYPNRDMLWSGFPTNWSLLKRLMWVRIMRGGSIPPAYETVTGNPVSFETVRPAPLKQLSVAFSPVQEGSGDPSPDNVRPISGWDSLTVEQAGKNLFDSDRFVRGYWLSGTWHENNWWGGVLIPCTPGTVISVSGNPTAGGVNGAWLNNHTDPTTGLVQTVSYAGVSKFTAPEGAYGLWLPLYAGNDWSALQIEYGDAPTAYEAPNIHSISISLGSTVYSGTVDVLTGVCTVDRGSLVVDGSTSLSVGSNQLCSIATQFKGMASAEIGLYKSDTFKAHINSGVANMNNEFTVDGYHVLLVKAPSLFTTTAEAKAYFTAHPTTFVAPLATPQTIQLTPQEVESLLGENNVWSTANGDLTVEYRSN